MNVEKLRQGIAKAKQLDAYLKQALSSNIHVYKVRKTLPKIIKELEEGLIEATGENHGK